MLEWLEQMHFEFSISCCLLFRIRKGYDHCVEKVMIKSAACSNVELDTFVRHILAPNGQSICASVIRLFTYAIPYINTSFIKIRAGVQQTQIRCNVHSL